MGKNEVLRSEASSIEEEISNKNRKRVLEKAFAAGNSKCIRCDMFFDDNDKDFFTIYGNINVADGGGLIGNNFDIFGNLQQASFLCFDCAPTYFEEQIKSVSKIRKTIEIGSKVLCWDSRIWNKRGKDLNHNEDCWKEAVVNNIRNDVKCCEGTDNEHIHPVLIDVIFAYDGFLSKGHFPNSIKKL